LAAIEKGVAGREGEFLRTILSHLTEYAGYAAPEIADDVHSIDNLFKWGFHWEIGPLQIANEVCAPRDPRYLILARCSVIEKTPEASLLDLGEGVICCELHTKMNTLSPAVARFLGRSRERAEREFAALVVGNQGPCFSAGYDLRLFLELIANKDWTGIDGLLQELQNVYLGFKYARVPVIGATHAYALGGGCEAALYCAAIQSSAELSMGLPEARAGLLPAGGGIKEMLARAQRRNGDDDYRAVETVFDLLCSGRVAGNAFEARSLGYLGADDRISINPDRLIADAREVALRMVSNGYLPPVKQEVLVLGEPGLARLRVRIDERRASLSEEKSRIWDRIAWVLCGGELSGSQSVGEEYLLRLEREAFVSLCTQPWTSACVRQALENRGER
jgi:3-hydroxyacyl-CoA dehydrogenase